MPAGWYYDRDNNIIVGYSPTDGYYPNPINPATGEAYTLASFPLVNDPSFTPASYAARGENVFWIGDAYDETRNWYGGPHAMANAIAERWPNFGAAFSQVVGWGADPDAAMRAAWNYVRVSPTLTPNDVPWVGVAAWSRAMGYAQDPAIEKAQQNQIAADMAAKVAAENDPIGDFISTFAPIAIIAAPFAMGAGLLPAATGSAPASALAPVADAVVTQATAAAADAYGLTAAQAAAVNAEAAALYAGEMASIAQAGTAATTLTAEQLAEQAVKQAIQNMYQQAGTIADTASGAGNFVNVPAQVVQSLPSVVNQAGKSVVQKTLQSLMNLSPAQALSAATALYKVASGTGANVQYARASVPPGASGIQLPLGDFGGGVDGMQANYSGVVRQLALPALIVGTAYLISR